MSQTKKGRVLFVGQSYYHTWYLSQELRKLGWVAHTLNTDPSEANQAYYHGEDFRFYFDTAYNKYWQLKFFIKSLSRYDVFHFSNAHHLKFLFAFDHLTKGILPQRWDIKLLKTLGKKIVFTTTACFDGVSQSSFAAWNQPPACSDCRWQNVPTVCSDERNLQWGKFRNEVADYLITNGGNRKDYNLTDKLHDVPQFYALDPSVWHPDLLIPANHKLGYADDVVKIYHAVGNFTTRTQGTECRNIKSTHVYLSVIERLKQEGHKVELVFVHDIPNKDVRYYMAQSDIVVDMLTFGIYGATGREALMLGKPYVCFMHPEWLDSMKTEVPEYVNELPVVSAAPDTVYGVLKSLVVDRERRQHIGKKSREFALKWHSAKAGAQRLDEVYTELLT